jgi:uncharacterized membrane protein
MNTGIKANVAGELSLHRLERLADIVFAVSILLLLMTLDFASEESSTAEKALEYFKHNMSQTLGYAISFILIAYYWISHQEYFSYYRSTNKTHTFIELIFLLTIAGMPFNNQFIVAFPAEIAPRLAISSDIVAAGVLTFFSWSYATSGNRLVDASEVDPDTVRFMRYQALVLPACAIVAAGCAYIHPFAWDVILTIGPLAGIALIKRSPKE